MKKYSLFTVLILFGFLAACSWKPFHHKTALPDPHLFDAHFGDMDTDGDGLVNWDAFKAYFSQAKPNVFEAIDGNNDKMLDHDEWHAFKAAHGLTHQD